MSGSAILIGIISKPGRLRELILSRSLRFSSHLSAHTQVTNMPVGTGSVVTLRWDPKKDVFLVSQATDHDSVFAKIQVSKYAKGCPGSAHGNRKIRRPKPLRRSNNLMQNPNCAQTPKSKIQTAAFEAATQRRETKTIQNPKFRIQTPNLHVWIWNFGSKQHIQMKNVKH